MNFHTSSAIAHIKLATYKFYSNLLFAATTNNKNEKGKHRQLTVDKISTG